MSYKLIIMLPNDQTNLKEIRKMVEENNHMLKKLRRGQIMGRVLRTLYWVIIIGAAVGAFYFIQPYVESLGGTFDNIPGLNFLDGGEESVPAEE